MEQELQETEETQPNNINELDVAKLTRLDKIADLAQFVQVVSEGKPEGESEVEMESESNSTLSDSTAPEENPSDKIAHFVQSAQLEKEVEQQLQLIDELDLINTPLIPESVYENLPELLKDASAVFESARERDVFLTGAITILSGCMNAVEGVYDSRGVYANLNCFIVAPPASGKGVFIYAKMMGEAYHDKLLEESKEALREYEELIKRASANEGEAASGESLQKPPFNILFIPGNSSSSAIMGHLIEGEGKGIFCETEADSLNNSLKQDWGNFSDLLRKAFHHENVSSSRKTNNEYYDIKRPQLSVALSGTPSQVLGLIPSAADGLFSRFIFYVFNSTPKWKNVAPIEGKPNLDEFFREVSINVIKLAEYLYEHPTNFNFTEEQWKTLNTEFEQMFNEVLITVGGDALSVVKRLGLVFYRIAMVLSSLRKFEQKVEDTNLLCTDNDFSISMQLAKVYKEHALLMFNRLPKTEEIDNKTVTSFYKILPNEFTRKQAIEESTKLALGVRTVDKYLMILVGAKLLIRPKPGHYSKV